MERAVDAAEPVWQYREDVLRLASHLCRHREDAEDVTQSALLKAAQHLDGFRREASLRTWLHRIATNECRMLRRRKVPLSLDELLEEAAIAEQPPSEPAASGPVPLGRSAASGPPDHLRCRMPALRPRRGLGEPDRR